MVASSVDAEGEASLTGNQEVNSSSYTTFHNAQIFKDGLSFSGNERNKVWINTGEAFADLSVVSGADIPNDSRAVIAADFDDDGDVDLFVHSIQRERHALFRNDALEPGREAGFLKLRLRATTGQYEAIGATVTVRIPGGSTSQVLSRGAGFVSCQVPELIFGLGDAQAARVEVYWPGGASAESFGEIRAGARVTLTEGAGAGESFAARTRSFADPLPPGLLLNEGDRIPILSVLDAKGRPTRLDVVELAGGKPILLNLWASYCAPCVAEMPLLQERHSSGDVFVIALSTDVLEDQDDARAVLAKRGATFPSFYLDLEGTPPDGAVSTDALLDLDRLLIPTTLGISPGGRLDTVLRGPLQPEGQ